MFVLSYLLGMTVVAQVPTVQLDALQHVCASLRMPICGCGAFAKELSVVCSSRDVAAISVRDAAFIRDAIIASDIGLLSNLEAFNIIVSANSSDSLVGTLPSGSQYFCKSIFVAEWIFVLNVFDFRSNLSDFVGSLIFVCSLN
jgi:hypothetical protein